MAVAFEGRRCRTPSSPGPRCASEIIDLDRGRDRAAPLATELGLPADRFVVAVMCGSQGAAAVNEVVAEVVDRSADRRDLAVYHVVGDRFLSDGRARSRRRSTASCTA